MTGMRTTIAPRVVRVGLGLALIAVPLRAQQATEQGRAVRGDAAIRIYNPAGVVRVMGWDRDSVAARVASASDEATGGRFFLGGSDRLVKLGIEKPPGSGGERPVPARTLEVRVPRGAHLWVNTESAAMEVSGITGPVELGSAGGSIALSGSPTDVRAETIDGSITLDVSSPHVLAKSASGTITLRGASREVDVATISGAIVAGADRVQRGRLSAVSGAVGFRGGLAPGGALEIETHSGTVTVHLPADVSADFDLTAIEGRIDNALTAARPGAGAGKRGQHLRFTTGRGGATVTITTFKGRIELRSP